MKTCLLLTTINIPILLEDYLAQAKGKDISFIVAGDLKTPPEARTYCEERGIEYMGEAEQNAYLEPYPELASYLPWNSVQRRNVAILKAYQDGAECIITIDDDNFCASECYFDQHFQNMREHISVENNEWCNPCDVLNNAAYPLYPRGFPISKRGSLQKRRVVVNAGLWLGDPDIDAVTRMAFAPEVEKMRKQYGPLPVGSWAPFNSQNTAIHRDAIPAYFLSPHIGRYDDIWASYIIKRLADYNGDCIHFGNPLVRQNRNPHDLFKDLELEMFGMRHTDDFCEQLRAAKVTAKGYKEGCLELLDQIKGEPYEEFIRGYRIWTNLF